MRIALILAVMLAASVSYAQVSASNVVENAKTETWTVASKAVSVQKSNRAETWRFVHDGATLSYGPWFGGGETTTKKNVVECKTFTLAVETILAKKLKLTDTQKLEIQQLAEEQKVDLVKLGWTLVAEKQTEEEPKQVTP